MIDAGLFLTVGYTVPDYELLRCIGRGAYGEVWLARSNATGVLRAAKIVWRRSFDDERPFQREFEGIQRFERISREHLSQLALFHIGRNEVEGYFYYLMELADNLGTAEGYAPRTLRADLQHGRLPAERVLEIGLALTEALGHLHGKGLVHRDVKPSNVIFVNGGPKLADIGLVTDTGDTRSIVGTEGYLPPEGPGTLQADIFALGKVLYEAATGLDRRQFPKLPPDLRSWPDAGHVLELNEILLKACATDPRQRYAGAESMLSELELLRNGTSIKSKRAWNRRWAFGRKAGVALVALALVAALVSVLPRQKMRSESSSDGAPSTNMEANALCVRGMYILRGDNYVEFAAAYTNFNKAIALDPNFARPYVGLLELRLREACPSIPPTTPEDMSAIARHLEELAPHSAPAYCAESIVNWSEWHYPEAARYVQEAIAADPKYELGHTWYGFMLTIWGWPEQGRKQLEIARSIAPSKVTIYRCLGQTYYARRDYTNAIAWYLTALKWEPHNAPAFMMIAQAFQALGDYTNAIDNNEKDELLWSADQSETTQRYAAIRRELGKGGIAGYWQDQWKRTEEHPNSDFYHKAVVQIHLGNTNAAMNWLEKAYETREHTGTSFQPSLSYLYFHDYWDGLHENPRFRKLLDKIGYTKVIPPPKK